MITRLYNFRPHYVPPDLVWIMATGEWNDNGIWMDDETWID